MVYEIVDDVCIICGFVLVMVEFEDLMGRLLDIGLLRLGCWDWVIKIGL